MVFSSQGARGQQRFYRIVGFENQKDRSHILGKILQHVDQSSTVFSSDVIEAPDTAGALQNELSAQIEKARNNNHKVDFFIFINGDKLLKPAIEAIKHLLQKSNISSPAKIINKIGLVNVASNEKIEGKGRILKGEVGTKNNRQIVMLSRQPKDLDDALSLLHKKTNLAINQNSASRVYS